MQTHPEIQLSVSSVWWHSDQKRVFKVLKTGVNEQNSISTVDIVIVPPHETWQSVCTKSLCLDQPERWSADQHNTGTNLYSLFLFSFSKLVRIQTYSLYHSMTLKYDACLLNSKVSKSSLVKWLHIHRTFIAIMKVKQCYNQYCQQFNDWFLCTFTRHKGRCQIGFIFILHINSGKQIIGTFHL